MSVAGKECLLSQPSNSIPKCPRTLAQVLRVLPLAPVSMSLNACARRIARNHPGLFRRLGEYSDSRFVLDPTDLPFFICLEPRGGTPRVTLTRRPCEGTARIAGPMAALFGLVHGAFDGDALFFSRDLVVEGDTSAPPSPCAMPWTMPNWTWRRKRCADFPGPLRASDTAADCPGSSVKPASA